MRYILCLLSLFCTGCVDYDRTASECRKQCEIKQENNIGARFFWRDFDRTFGKCTCISEDGSTQEFYMKVIKKQ